MISENPFKNEKVENHIVELRRSTARLEGLLREIPTTDAQVLGELHSLTTCIDRLLSEDPGREKNAMLLDQARRQARFQRQRYMRIVQAGLLRDV